MAAPRNYLYHLITRVARCRAERRRADGGNGRGSSLERSVLAVLSRTHRSIGHRCEESGILCSPSRYRAADNEDVRTYVRRNKGRRKRDRSSPFSLSLLVSFLFASRLSLRAECRKLNLGAQYKLRTCTFPVVSEVNGNRLNKALRTFRYLRAGEGRSSSRMRGQ